MLDTVVVVFAVNFLIAVGWFEILRRWTNRAIERNPERTRAIVYVHDEIMHSGFNIVCCILFLSLTWPVIVILVAVVAWGVYKDLKTQMIEEEFEDGEGEGEEEEEAENQD